MHHLFLFLLVVALALFFLLPWWLALPLSLPFVGLVLFTSYKSHQAMRQQPRTGEEAMIGDRAIVTRARQGKLEVRYRGEIWQAVSLHPVSRGETVFIEKIDGLTLGVAPLPSEGDDRPSG